MSADHNAAYNYDEIMKLTAMIAAQSLDYLLMDEVARDYYLKAANLIDLSSELTDAQLEAIRDSLVYQEQGDGSSIPLAVDLTGTAFAAQCGLPQKTTRCAWFHRPHGLYFSFRPAFRRCSNPGTGCQM